jgi:hypothetical protein
MVGIVSERLAQDCHCNINASIEFHDGIVRPKNPLDLLAGKNVALALHQDSQNLEGLPAELDFCGTSFHSRRPDRDKFTRSDVELKCSKSDSLGQIGRLIHGAAAKLPCVIT